MQNNINNLRKYMKQNGIDAVLLVSAENVYYMSGFNAGGAGYSDARIIITAEEQYIITDSRYTTYTKKACPDFTLEETSCTSLDAAVRILQKHPVRNIAFENMRILFTDFQNYFMKLGAELVPLYDTIEQMRIIKSEEEYKSIKRACEISCEALKQTLPYIKAGVTEIEVAARLEFAMRTLGSENTAFDTIVVSGEKSAMPHGMPSDKIICGGDAVTIDFGAVYNGYCSDMTRTFFVGTPCDELVKIYNTVLEAQLKAIDSFKHGMACKDLDAVARQHISDCGYGSYFGHSLGHGVGLEIHEAPSVSSRNETIIQPGMIFSVEPGIYVENLGGVRIEDLVTEIDGKLEILTGSIPKSLTVL